MFITITTPIRDAHESPSHIYGTAHGERCGQCGELIQVDHDNGIVESKCACFTTHQHTADTYMLSILEQHQELAAEHAEQHLCGYSDECEGQRDGVWFEGQLLRFARSVPLVGCAATTDIHRCPTLVPTESQVA